MRSNIESEKEEERQLKAIEIAQRVSFLPELQCSNNNIVDDNCIDILKLDAASNIIKNNEAYYYNKLFFSTATIKEIYPDYRNWAVYNRTISDYKSKITTNVPIALFDPTLKKYHFGVMTIDVFDR